MIKDTICNIQERKKKEIEKLITSNPLTDLKVHMKKITEYTEHNNLLQKVTSQKKKRAAIIKGAAAAFPR